MTTAVSFSELTAKECTRTRPPGDLQDVQVTDWCRRCGCELYTQTEIRRGLCTDCSAQKHRLELLSLKRECNGLRELCHICDERAGLLFGTVLSEGDKVKIPPVQ